MKINVICLGLIVVGASIMTGITGDVTSRAADGENIEPFHTPFAPIRIDSDADFDAAHGVVNWATGDGSAGNPWVIEGYEINGTGYGYCVYVGNTTDHFTVQDCLLRDSFGSGDPPYHPNSGLAFYNNTNGIAYNNTLTANVYYGIYMDAVHDMVLRQNNVSDNTYFGIKVENSAALTIENNLVADNNDGIHLDVSCTDSVVANNTILGNTNHAVRTDEADQIRIVNNTMDGNSYGVYLWYSTNISIEENFARSGGFGAAFYTYHSENVTASLNNASSTFNGFLLSNSGHVNLTANDVHANTFGFRLIDSENVTIFHNNILFNSNQAADNNGPENTWDDGYPSGGNYWSDYAGVDLFSGPGQDIPGSDGIGDTNYTIDADSIDRYPLMGPWVSAQGPVHNIDKDLYYNTIQAGVDDADPGNTLTVAAGTYPENVLVNKTLTLHGESMTGTIVDAGGTSASFHISADWVNVSGFTFRNGGSGSDDAGLVMVDSEWCSIAQVIAESNNYDGIVLVNTNHTTISDSITRSNNDDGLYLEWSSNNTFTNLTSTLNGWYGVWLLDYSNFNQFFGCDVHNNSIFGFYLDLCDFNEIEGNVVNDNYDGIYLSSCRKTDVLYNTVDRNTRFGIHLDYSDDCLVEGNDLTDNTRFGILLDTSVSNELLSNALIGNSIFIQGNQMIYWNTHSIGASNTVNGKPVQYLKNQTGGSVPPGAGEVILANCADIVVQDQAMAGANVAILMGCSVNVSIINVTLSNQDQYGIYACAVNFSVVTDSTIQWNNYGLYLHNSHNNTVSGNALINNAIQAFDNGDNRWNESYPVGGNYWSDYAGFDNHSGPNQDLFGSDGFGDTPHAGIIGPSGAIDHYPLMYTELTAFTVALHEGWNLISFPLAQLNTSITEVLIDIDGKWDYVRAYDPTAALPWVSYSTHMPAQLNTLHDLTHMLGFWINITESGVNLTITGYLPSSTTMLLRAGWNLVSYPSLIPRTVTEALAGTGYDAVEGYNSTSPYQIGPLDGSDMMTAGNGYWVHVPADAVWTVDW